MGLGVCFAAFCSYLLFLGIDPWLHGIPSQNYPKVTVASARAAVGIQEKTPADLCFVRKPSIIAFLESTPQFCHIMPMVGFLPVIRVLWSLIAWTRELFLPV